MKIIDKRGKLFGKVSILDILIICVIIAVGLVVYNKVFNKQAIMDNKEYKTMTYEVEIQNVAIEMTNDVVKLDDKLYDSRNGDYLGVLKQFHFGPKKVIIANKEEKKYEEIEVPNKKTLTILIEGQGYETTNDVFIESANTKVGKRVYVKGKGYAGLGYITKVNYK